MKIIIIDDDPTGSQTVHDCLLLLRWDYQTLLKGLKSKSNLLFILANTRSLSEEDVEYRLNEICISLKNVISREEFKDQNFLLVSRGDSTLRGHNFLEPFVINKILGPFDATFHIPAFLEGNRTTLNGQHYVKGVLAHKTIYAKDRIFGYQTSFIKSLLIQKSNSKLNEENVKNLNLLELDLLDVNKQNRIYKFLDNLRSNKHIIVDIDNHKKLEKFCDAIKKLSLHKRFLFRTAASFISTISDTKKNNKNNLYYSKLRRKNNQNKFLPGLIIVGSYNELSSNQLKNFLKLESSKGVELNVFHFQEILNIKNNDKLIFNFKNQILNNLRNIFKESYTPVLFTSRELITFEYDYEQIKFFNFLSSFIAEIVSEIKYEIGYLISKGGITSNTILQKGFNIDYVYLEGQIITGISFLTLQLSNTNSKIPVVTFPGNLGEENSLISVWQAIEKSN